MFFARNATRSSVWLYTFEPDWTGETDDLPEATGETADFCVGVVEREGFGEIAGFVAVSGATSAGFSLHFGGGGLGGGVLFLRGT